MNNNQLDFLTYMGFIVGIVALMIGLENLQENRQQSTSQENLLKYLEEHLKSQDLHLANQDKLLKERSNNGN